MALPAWVKGAGRTTRFAVCLKTDDDSFDLQVGKVYRLLPDRFTMESGWIRVIDDSGEDYLYPSQWFEPVELSRKARAALRKSADQP